MGGREDGGGGSVQKLREWKDLPVDRSTRGCPFPGLRVVGKPRTMITRAGRGTTSANRVSLFCTGVAQSLASRPPVSVDVGFRHQ